MARYLPRRHALLSAMDGELDPSLDEIEPLPGPGPDPSLLLREVNQGVAPVAKSRVPAPGAADRLTAPGYKTSSSASFNDPKRTGSLLRGAAIKTAAPPLAPSASTDPSEEVVAGSTAPPSAVPRPQTGTSFLEALNDQYQRRGMADRSTTDKIGGSILGAAPTLAMTGVGAPIAGAMAAVGGLMKLFGRTAKSAKSDFYQEDARDIISRLYTGNEREAPTSSEMDAILASQGWEKGDRWVGEKGLTDVLNRIAGEFDAEDAQSAATAQTEVPGTSPTTPGATVPPVPRGIGSGGGLAFTGFNFQRAQDPTTSAKDAFAEAVSNAPAITDTSKPGAEAWFRQYVAPEMEKYGWQVLDVKGDQAFITSRERPEGGWVDWMTNAGGENPEFAWQDQSEMGGGGGGGGGMPTAGGPSGGSDILSLLGSDSALAEIMAALQKLTAKGQTPTNLRSQILGNLGGPVGS